MGKAADQAKPAAEVMKVTQARQFSDADLAALASWDDIAIAVREKALETVDISDFGTGFEVLDKKDKARLVEEPFAILDWRFNPGDFGESFVSMLVLTQAGKKYVVNDGGTGIRQQMQTLTSQLAAKLGVDEDKARAVVKCPKGLTRSDYQYVDGDGEKKPATTFYLSLEK